MRTQTQLKEIMTRDVEVVTPETTARQIALKMQERDIGAIPVCDGNKILGQVTDRDITLKVVAQGKDADGVKASEIMSSPIIWAYEDQDVEEAAELMEENQIRRLVIVDREKRLVGVVALGDLATKAGDDLAGEALEEISRPH